MFDKPALMDLVRQQALQVGDFTLASGKKSHYYLDCRKITLDSWGANLIADGMLELLGDPLPAAVGGMAIGADPITAAILTLAWHFLPRTTRRTRRATARPSTRSTTGSTNISPTWNTSSNPKANWPGNRP